MKPNKLIPLLTEKTFEDVKQEIYDLIRILSEVSENNEELMKLVPFVKNLYLAVGWTRRKRAIKFLRLLCKIIENYDDKKRKKFKKLINSPIGMEILSDYVETVIKTSSELATASLALLYSDSECEKYSSDFKLSCVQAIEGISDNLIEFHIQMVLLLERCPKKRDERPYPLFSVDSIRENLPELCRDEIDTENWIRYLHELILRGILLPDYQPGGFAGAIFWFGIGKRSLLYRDLFCKAKRLL